MRELIERIPPKYRRWAVVAVVVAAFSLILTITGSITGGGRSENTNPDENRVENILTDRDSSGARLERLQAQFENMNDEKDDLAQEVDRLNRTLSREQEQGVNAELQAEMQEMRNILDQLRSEGMIQQDDESGGIEVTIPSDDDSASARPGQSQAEPPVEYDPSAPAYQRQLDQMAQESDPMWAQAGDRGSDRSGGMSSSMPAAPGADASAGGEDGEGASEPQSAIRSITRGSGNGENGEGEEIDISDAETSTEDDDSVYIPTGSIVTGTLITGMDAPTGQQARQDPHPALMRIKHEAILPNRFRADIRECFVLMGGRGSLSSERAYLRGETISCVREDGGVVEASMNSYTVGEDGKAGVRGRLVSKQGQFLARALMAGFLESFANAFDQTPVPSIDINEDGEGSGQQIYQQAFSGDALQSATVSGAGKAMDRLAQFYIDQAEGLFPVIEIDAGREVEIVLINGTSLQIR